MASPPGATTPEVRAGGLVTLAFLKARLDEGEDHLGIFMPLVLDVVPGLANRNFVVSDVQSALAETHGVAMPQAAVATLLKRAVRRHILIRDAGRFHANPDRELPRSNVDGQKALIGKGQLRLGEALQHHASKRGLTLDSADDALGLLLRFMEEEQVALLLGIPSEASGAEGLSQLKSGVIAEFLHDVVEADHALMAVLTGMLEGLVLYHAAFLPDLAASDRKFHDLKVYFDSVLVRQALGYEGEGARILMRDTVDLLKRSGVQCLVFDKTVQEIHRILSMYESKLATSMGRKSLRQVPMTRHFLVQRFTPSDVQEMTALLEPEIAAVGLLIQPMPSHTAKFTSDENALAERLANSKTHDKLEPRVTHDVDCVAAVLTMRQGRRSRRIEDAHAVFATTSFLVIQTTRAWWEEDEREAGVPPLVHIRSLANLAWLKNPSLNGDFHVRELVALCSAAMRPSQRTWRRFLDYLDSLQASQRLSTDEVTAIIVSAVSDQLLREAELEEGSSEDLDAETLDEVVARVKADYSADAEKRVRELAQSHERDMANALETAEAAASRAREAERSAAEQLRRREMAIEGRARRWARRAVSLVFWILVGVVIVGEVAVVATVRFPEGWVGVLVGLAVVVATVLGALGILRQLSDLRTKLEARLQMRLRDWLRNDADAR
jgi:hypothetical protein